MKTADITLEQTELNNEIIQLVKHALEEDLPQGDITSDHLGIQNKYGHAKLIAKQDLCLSGIDFFMTSFLLLDSDTQFLWHFGDGEEVIKGQCICELKGNYLSFLKSERVGLNYLGHLSGISTLSHQFYQQVKHTKTKILDTRKTFPGFRKWQKQAVLDGGCHNHRFSLSDAIMLKENHIQAAGSISKAISNIRKRSTLPIEVETSNLDEVKEAVKAAANRIMLDNMNNEQIKDALKHIPKNIETEASGNMSLERVSSVAELGVDFISVGALTHSAPTADISLLFDWNL